MLLLAAAPEGFGVKRAIPEDIDGLRELWNLRA